MRDIWQELLWIGHAGDARNFTRLLEVGIQAIVDLAANEPPLVPPRDLVYCRFPVIDGAGNPDWLLSAAIKATASLLEAKTRTLVFCSAGLSRSPAIAAAALAKVTNSSLAECLKTICSDGPHDVSPQLWHSVWLVCG